MTDDRIKPFLFEGEVTVRVIERDGAPWFVATDVCRALGLTNPAETVRGLDEDEKGISTTDTLGGHQEAVVISESGLYALIFKSRKPHAIRFRKWVTAEVLPSLRRPATVGHDGFVSTRRLKPWAERTLEEQRLNLTQINTSRRVHGQAAAAWTWVDLGLPTPPAYLLPVWWQSSMALTIQHPPAN